MSHFRPLSVPNHSKGMCGSCWAFSAIVAIEVGIVLFLCTILCRCGISLICFASLTQGALFLDTGNLTSLSEQELIDCDHNDLGCGGGLMDNAFLFDENSTGICSELDYPYVMHKRWLRGCGPENGECKPVEHTRVNTFVDVENSVEALMEAIAQQPVSVAMYEKQEVCLSLLSQLITHALFVDLSHLLSLVRRIHNRSSSTDQESMRIPHVEAI